MQYFSIFCVLIASIYGTVGASESSPVEGDGVGLELEGEVTFLKRKDLEEELIALMNSVGMTEEMIEGSELAEYRDWKPKVTRAHLFLDSAVDKKLLLRELRVAEKLFDDAGIGRPGLYQHGVAAIEEAPDKHALLVLMVRMSREIVDLVLEELDAAQ